MVKLVDTRDLKSLGDLAVPVQVRLGPPQNSFYLPANLQKNPYKSNEKAPDLSDFSAIFIFNYMI